MYKNYFPDQPTQTPEELEADIEQIETRMVTLRSEVDIRKRELQILEAVRSSKARELTHRRAFEALRGE